MITMAEGHGFWYSVGRAFYKYFDFIQWTYEHTSPNKILIVVGFVCFAWWMKWQADYNKKALKEGGLK